MKSLVQQLVIGLVTSVVVAVVVEMWREREARAPLPQPPVPGHDYV